MTQYEWILTSPVSMSAEFVLGSETVASGTASKLAAELLCTLLLLRRLFKPDWGSTMPLREILGTVVVDVLLLWCCPLRNPVCCRHRGEAFDGRNRTFLFLTRGLVTSGESAPIPGPLNLFRCYRRDALHEPHWS